MNVVIYNKWKTKDNKKVDIIEKIRLIKKNNNSSIRLNIIP